MPCHSLSGIRHDNVDETEGGRSPRFGGTATPKTGGNLTSKEAERLVEAALLTFLLKRPGWYSEFHELQSRLTDGWLI